jgi:hypothetical protein
VISPALFNIFIEDLSEDLKSGEKEIWKSFYYADDLLTICDDEEQLKKAIKIIDDWSKRNGMLLNKKKSGIIIFARRKAIKIPMMETEDLKNSGRKTMKRKWVPTQDNIGGIPICEKYKYLGTILTPKLTLGEQIAFINRKSAHIFTKLSPYLQNASADGRRDMWQTMIRPLFNAAFVLLEYEPSKTNRENLKALWRVTFKRFMLLKKRTSTELVEQMISCDLEKIVKSVVQDCKKKWEERKRGESISSKESNEKQVNLLRGVPNKWCELVNTHSNPCLLCRTEKYPPIGTSYHLSEIHGIYLKPIKEIWEEEICTLTKQDRLKRREIAEKLFPILQEQIDEYTRYRSQVINRISGKKRKE